MIQATGITTPGCEHAHSYLVTMDVGGVALHRELTPREAGALAESLLLEACNLLRSNPRGDHHNTRAYIHDLAAIAEAWQAEEDAEEQREADRETARRLERRDDMAVDRDAAYLEAGSPHPHDR